MEPIRSADPATFVLADGGMETTLIFDRGVELPLFAAFVLLEDEQGRAALRDYYAPYLALAERHGVRFLLDTPTWRANGDWGAQLGYSAAALDAVNRSAAAFVQELRAASGRPDAVVCAGVLGPRGDGYQVNERLSAEEAQAYHGAQVASGISTRDAGLLPKRERPGGPDDLGALDDDVTWDAAVRGEAEPGEILLGIVVPGIRLARI